MNVKDKAIVITQPYFFPWIGLFEQIRSADIFVYYDDVQFSRGHFQDRVQIKTDDGFKWITIPKKSLKLNQLICEVEIDYKKNWKRSHLDFLKQVYRPAPFCKEMLQIVDSVYGNNYRFLSELTINSIRSVGEYYGLFEGKYVFISSDINIPGKSTQRVLDIVKSFHAARYITGMGALRYFDFTMFEEENISVEFSNYCKLEYPQLYGKFNPFVSVLDLIANTGKEGIRYIGTDSIYWRNFIKTPAAREYLDTH